MTVPGAPAIPTGTRGADDWWMARALALARTVVAVGEVPVAALLVKDQRLVSVGVNGVIRHCDPTDHAEIVALRRGAQRVGNYRLGGMTLYVTLEPCPMCAGALVHSRLQRLVFGAFDPRTGAAGSALDVFAVPSLNHRVQVTPGVLAADCGDFLRDFFRQKRLMAAERSRPAAPHCDCARSAPE